MTTLPSMARPARVTEALHEYVPRVFGHPDDADAATLERLVRAATADSTPQVIVQRPIERAVARLEAGSPFRTFWDYADPGADDLGSWQRKEGYREMRAQREAALGYGRDTIYGALTFDRAGAAPSVGPMGYGTVGFVLDTAHLRQVTVLPGDSIDERDLTRAAVAPGEWGLDAVAVAVDRLVARQVQAAGGWAELAAKDPATAAKFVAYRTDPADVWTPGYVEAAWHPAQAGGRLALDGVRELRVGYPGLLAEFETNHAVIRHLPALRDAAAARGIPVVEVGLPGRR